MTNTTDSRAVDRPGSAGAPRAGVEGTRRVPSGSSTTRPVTLRSGRAADFVRLVRLERRAAARFPAALGVDPEATCPAGVLQRALVEGLLPVAGHPGSETGFAAAVPRAGWLHLEEVSVDPEHGRRGIGRALVARVIEAARDLELAGVTLTTFGSVPFNAPFYRGLGFEPVSGAACPAHLAARLDAERKAGLVDRVAMLFALEAASGHPEAA